MKRKGDISHLEALEKEKAAAMAQLVREEYRSREDARPEPDGVLGWIVGLLGFPVKAPGRVERPIPFVTVVVCLVLVAAFIWSCSVEEKLVRSLSLVPQDWSSLGGLTTLTSAFLHGNVAHLLVSIYFIAVFGSDVEAQLGRWRFLAVLIICAAAGGVGFVLLSTGSPERLTGADGAVSGILSMFAVLNPGRRVRILVVATVARWAVMPAWTMLVLWPLGLVFVDFNCLSADSGVAVSAHAGGLLMGVVLGFAWRAGAPRSEEKVPTKT